MTQIPGMPPFPGAPVQPQPAAPAAPVQPQPAAPAAPAHLLSLADAHVGNGSGQYLPPGVEVVAEIVSWRDKPSKKTPGQWNNILEFRVLETNSTAVQIGGVYSLVNPYQDQWGFGRNDIKGYCVQAIEALRPELAPAGTTWQDSYKDWLVGADQPATGLRMHIRTWQPPDKTYTKKDVQFMDAGATMGLVPQAPAPAAAPAPVAAPAAAPAPVAAPAAAPAPVAAPPGWPAHLHYPSGRPL